MTPEKTIVENKPEIKKKFKDICNDNRFYIAYGPAFASGGHQVSARVVPLQTLPDLTKVTANVDNIFKSYNKSSWQNLTKKEATFLVI